MAASSQVLRTMLMKFQFLENTLFLFESAKYKDISIGFTIYLPNYH